VQDADPQLAPFRDVVRGCGGEFLLSGLGHLHDGPARVLAREQGQGPLVAARLHVLPDGRGFIGALACGPGREAIAEPAGQLLGGHRTQAPQQPMRGKDHQARVLHGHERHQRVACRVVLAQRARFVNLLAVLAGRLVAVVAVGNVHGLGSEQGCHIGDHAHVGHRPQAVHGAPGIGGHQGRAARNGGIQQTIDLAVRVGVQAEHGAEVGLGDHGEHEPVELRGRGGLLVGEHESFAKRRQEHAGHKATAHVLLACILELLAIHVQGWISLLEQDPFGAPILEKAGRAGVAVVGLVVPVFHAVEVHAHEVAWVAAVEIILQGRVDDVVGRADHVAQRADVAQVVADAAKGLDLGHGEKGARG